MSLPHHVSVRSSGQPLPPAASVEARVSLLRIATLIMRQRGLVAGTALLFFAAVVAALLIIPGTYSTYSSFVPQSENGPVLLSGLAAQFGLNLPGSGGQPGRSPAFYADLVTTRQILGAVVDTAFTFGGGRPKSLIEVYRSTGKTPAVQREAAIRQLSRNIRITVNQETGAVKLRVIAIHPELALQINQLILALINEFNLHTRQSQAAMERRFTENRLEEVRRSLREAEDREQVFLQRNRDFRNSPELTFQQERLARQIAERHQVYSVLLESYERAKIDEVRDTPVITVVERPELPARHDPRGLIKWGMAALLGGVLLGTMFALARNAFARSREEEPAEFAEFAELRRQSASDLLHPWRPLQRLVGRRERR